MRQFREDLGRAKVGEEAQFLAQAQYRLFRAKMAFQRVAVGIADRAEQDGVGALGRVERFGRQRMADRLIGCAADEAVFKGEAGNRQRIQHALCLSDDFRADAVSGEQGDQHGETPYITWLPLMETGGFTQPPF